MRMCGGMGGALRCELGGILIAFAHGGVGEYPFVRLEVSGKWL